MSQQHFDVLIIGGGVVGAGLALGLAPHPLKIALVDAGLPSANDPRLFALNQSSCQFLTNIGLWAQLKAHASPINEVYVSRRGRFGSVRLKAQDIELSELGHVIPAYHIEAAMNLALQNIQQFRPAKVTQLALTSTHGEVTVQQDNQSFILHADLIIGADGTDSAVRNLLKIPAQTFDYEQTAIVTRTTIQRSHQGIAHERFLDNGAIAMLPLGENECATIWTVQGAVAQILLSLADEDFLQRLQSEFGYRLGRFKAISKRYSYPLKQVKTKEYSHKYVFLLGNAAHTLHPIAAQGFNLALYEVAVLIDQITQNKTLNVNQQQQIALAVSHHLAQLFTKDSLFSQLAIHLGMAGLDLIKPAKRKFLNSLMGKSGSVPPLLLD